ncbi:S9 family peptidase [Oscillatoria sp. FACHB-1407]|uniref:S9 family peptidase n=1 Tax=Oscillatoria sp. FACHB-1407 TaxID=2692847 RepID=UPI001687FED5|nr:S9 family peptidase [Oscillatoria sp. FACHB-1407]MBD2464948.1 S9 family peptidase [Oscillatoria sp. FACHB-1407]
MGQQAYLETKLSPPVAEKHPHILSIHEDERVDPYYWMRDRNDSNVIAYLEAENAYTQAVMQHTEGLQKALYDEMLGRIKETDLSVPYRKDNFYYYTRTEEGKAYPIYCRKKGSLEGEEEVILDQNVLAEGHEFLTLGVVQVSPDHRLLAYSVDTAGNELYTLYFLDLTTRERYPEAIAETYYSLEWANDSRTVFYTQVDSTNRPYKLFRHVVGTPASEDVLVYHETDESYFLGVEKTRSEAYLLMSLGSKITSEVHYLKADDPLGEFQVIQPRSHGMEYSVDHHGDHFYIVTNNNAINFKLVKTPVTTPDQPHWETIIPHREDVLLSGISVFTDHLVIYERQGGLPTVRVQKLSTGEEHSLSFPEPTYSVREGSNPEFNTNILRFSYSSMITPSSVFDYNLDTQERELKKETEVLGGYDRTQYASEWISATAPDGVQVPISIVYKRGTLKDGSNPLLLTGYGSYGVSYPVTFSSNRLSLLDRGVVIALAHIRGGSELGRKWYDNGKFLNKKNTFTDFIACAEHLIQEGWTSRDRLAINGGSAGGLLMGAVINLRPDLFKAVVADVPFVDVVTTILDPTLPLSVLEWEEWGNPNDKTYYDYMKSYSPYDNVTAKDYPALLITAGLNDSRVSYWEPAKWTAKLRDLKTDNNVLLLKTNMGAGHGGASGRYESLKEIAFEYAFLLDQWGIAKPQ